MIVPMVRLRILGPRERLDRTLEAVQDAGLLHLAERPASEALRPMELTLREHRETRQLQRVTSEMERTLSRLGVIPDSRRQQVVAMADRGALARWAREAHRLHRELDRLDARVHDLEEERAQMARFAEFMRAFHGLLPGGTGRMQSYQLVLRGEDTGIVPRLRQALGGVLGNEFSLETAPLPSGELAAVLLVPAPDAPQVERLLAQAGVGELPVPERFVGRPTAELLPAVTARQDELDRELVALRAHREERIRQIGPDLAAGRATAADRLLHLSAYQRAGVTPRGFVLEGWIPAASQARFGRTLGERLGPEVVVETVGREEWRGDEAPVVLHNPRLFRPFEAVTRKVPLPAYGTIDPTPFVAVFFPMFFGLILGDIGYGLALAGLALLVRSRGSRDSARRAVGEILGACAAFSVLFGIGFGEFFGDLGRRWFGLHPVLFDREEALLPFLGLTVAIGLVHITIGLVLGVINAARGHPRHAVGKGVGLVMLLTMVVALLAAAKVLPGGFFTPAVVLLLAAFPVLVVAEGIIAPIEFLSTLSNILSYARIMALGTASVMMAVVANRLAGSFGGAVVGLLFGLLFHLVNFALGIFAPTIHGLRLHYVEFFGKFYSPGGQEYRPFSHWRPAGARAA
jgi:V/A-type H+/Na+-transporting ATPase subunit I